MIFAVTLDAAGTLICPSENVGHSYCRIASRHGATLDALALGRGFKRVFHNMPPMAFPSSDSDELDRKERAWWKLLVKQVTDDAGGVPAFDAYFDELYDYFAQPQAWQLYPEIMPLLHQLRRQEIRVAVVSNFDSRLLPVLEGLGVSPLVDAVIYSTAANSAKPDAQIFINALKTLSVDAASCLHVGDNHEADYMGARRAGLHAVLVVRDQPAASTAPSPDNQIADLIAVPALLTTLA